MVTYSLANDTSRPIEEDEFNSQQNNSDSNAETSEVLDNVSFHGTYVRDGGAGRNTMIGRALSNHMISGADSKLMASTREVKSREGSKNFNSDSVRQSLVSRKESRVGVSAKQQRVGSEDTVLSSVER